MRVFVFMSVGGQGWLLMNLDFFSMALWTDDESDSEAGDEGKSDGGLF